MEAQALLQRAAARRAHSLRLHTCGLRRVFFEAQKVTCPEGAREARWRVSPKKRNLTLFRHLRMTELCEAIAYQPCK